MAARRFYEQARTCGDSSATSNLETLDLDVRCDALGARVEEPGSARDGEDCGLDYCQALGSGDFKEAVTCAERARHPEVLAMLYANGQGVTRDVARAIRHACDFREVSRERDAILNTLFSIQARDSREPFDFCKHVMSGANTARCAAYTETTTGDADDDAVAAAAASWTAAARAEWAKLAPIAEAYLDAEANLESEGSRGGTAHEAEYRYARLERRHAFETMVASLREFHPDAAPPPGRLEAVDRKRNEVYRCRMREVDAPTQQALRDAERAWIRYRDAVTALYEAELGGRYGARVVEQAVRVKLTRERSDLLRTLDLATP